MSDLYHVRVEAVTHKGRGTQEALTLRITTVHPDAGPPLVERSFIMSLVYDFWRELEGSILLGNGCWERPADHPAEKVALALQEPWAPVMLRARALHTGFRQPATEEQIAWWRGKEGEPEWRRQISVRTPGGKTSPHKSYCEMREDPSSPTGYSLVHVPRPCPLSSVGYDQVTHVEERDPRNQEHHDAQRAGDMSCSRWPERLPGEPWEQRLTRLPSVTLYATFKQKNFLGFITPGDEVDSAAYE